MIAAPVISASLNRDSLSCSRQWRRALMIHDQERSTTYVCSGMTASTDVVVQRESTVPVRFVRR